MVRGVAAVSGLPAFAGPPGWVALQCASAAMARWLADAITRENVQARHDGVLLLVPVSADYTLGGEIKSVVTVVAKTTDYWFNHMSPDVRRALEMGETLDRWKARVSGWLGWNRE